VVDTLSISTAASDKSLDFPFSPVVFPGMVGYEAKVKLESPSKKKGGMRFEGHRGAGALEPENTLKAFQKAIDLEIDGVELDVWISKDGVPIVVHGTDDGLVHFKETSLTTFAFNVYSKDLKDWKLPNDESIPTLEEVLLLCKDRIHVNIELKEESERVVKPTLELVQRMNMLNQVCFSSFVHKHKGNLEKARQELAIEKELEFGFLVWQLEDFPEYKKTACNGDTLNIDIELLQKHEAFILGEIAQAREKNMKIKFYFGFDQEENDDVYRKLEELKVDTLIINHPHRSVAFLTQA